MRIHTAASSRFHASQIQRIEKGFVELGHEITPHPSEADLIYQNNPWFDQIIVDKVSGRLRGKIIFNVQDIPHHHPSYDLARLDLQLSHADAITAISATTANDVAAVLQRAPSVVYQPIMPVTRTGDRKYPQYRALFCGRVSDPNKRADVGAQALQFLGFTHNEVLTVGGESPFFGGTYWGVAHETTLNELYNSMDYVMCMTRFAGTELTMIEAMAAGAIPVVCCDLHTREEFLPSALFPEYLSVDANPRSVALFIAQFEQDNGAKAAFKQRLHQHYLDRWAEPFSSVGVARRILQVYETLST